MFKSVGLVCVSLTLALSLGVGLVSAKSPDQMTSDEKIGQMMCFA